MYFTTIYSSQREQSITERHQKRSLTTTCSGAPVEDLHAAQLGRPSHGASREGGLQALHNGRLRPAPAPHCAHQAVHCIALHLHEHRHMHTAHLQVPQCTEIAGNKARIEKACLNPTQDARALFKNCSTWQTRPRSLRKRSTIIRFSAWSFSDAARAAAAAASAAASWQRDAVPLMGRASRSPFLLPLRKRSGEEQHTCSSHEVVSAVLEHCKGPLYTSEGS